MPWGATCAPTQFWQIREGSRLKGGQSPHPHRQLSSRLGPDRHPLGDDILSGLIGLFPRRKPRQQLWMFFDSELRTRALYGAAYLEGAYLDGATVHEIRSLLVEGPGATWLFGRLKQTRGTEGYPLNSQFLDSVLCVYEYRRARFALDRVDS